MPAPLVEKLDLTTLKQQSGSYVSKELEKTVSDVVYTCRRTDNKGSVNVSLLLEHKSKPDRNTPIQVGGYLFSAYQQQIKQRQQLTPVIPIVLYHGRYKWEYCTLGQLFGDLAADLLDFLPSFDYVYHDLRDTPEEHIQVIDNRYLAGALLMLKYALRKRQLKAKFPEILTIGLAQGSDDQQAALLIYGLTRVDFTEEQIKEVVKELPLTIKDKVMRSTYDLLIEKGIEKGMEKGMEKGIEKGIEQGKSAVVANLLMAGKFTISEIANFATVTEDFVKEVQSDLNRKKK